MGVKKHRVTLINLFWGQATDSIKTDAVVEILRKIGKLLRGIGRWE